MWRYTFCRYGLLWVCCREGVMDGIFGVLILGVVVMFREKNMVVDVEFCECGERVVVFVD